VTPLVQQPTHPVVLGNYLRSIQGKLDENGIITDKQNPCNKYTELLTGDAITVQYIRSRNVDVSYPQASRRTLNN